MTISYGDYHSKSYQMNQAIQQYYAAYGQYQQAYAKPAQEKNNLLPLVGVGLGLLVFKNEIKTLLKQAFSSHTSSSSSSSSTGTPNNGSTTHPPTPVTPWTDQGYDPSYYASVGENERTGYRTASENVYHKGQLYFRKDDEYSMAFHDIRKQITRGTAKSLQEAIDIQKTSGYDAVKTTDVGLDCVQTGTQNRKARQSAAQYTGFNVADNGRVGKDLERHVIIVAPPKTDVKLKDCNGNFVSTEVNLEGEVQLNQEFFQDKFKVGNTHVHVVRSFKPDDIKAKMKEVQAKINAKQTHNGHTVKHEVVVQMLPFHGINNADYKMGQGETPEHVDPKITETELKKMVKDHLGGRNVAPIVMTDACYSGNIVN